jgi:putative resolvase
MPNSLKTIGIGEFAKRIGVAPLTVRRWIYKGLLKPLKTTTGRYRFTEEHIKQALDIKGKTIPKKTVIYARVSTAKQKEYLQNQIELCKKYAVSKGYSIDEIITDVASFFNFKRKGLNHRYRVLARKFSIKKCIGELLNKANSNS